MIRIHHLLLCLYSYFFLAQGFSSETIRVTSISRLADKPFSRGVLSSTLGHHQFVDTQDPHRHLDLDDSTRFNVLNLRQRMWSLVMTTTTGTGIAVKQAWWCFPLILVLVPIHAMLTGQYAQMPEFWPLIDLGSLTPLSFMGFLASNVFYFLSGLFLLNKIRLPEISSSKTFQRMNVSFHTSRKPMLGASVMLSGLVSLIYHTFQGMGHTPIAESLCYVDHGVALSCSLYFLKQCGIPSYKTLSIGIPSLGLLAAPVVETYPFLHSLWHLLSAVVTISWASDGVHRRKTFITSEPKTRRS